MWHNRTCSAYFSCMLWIVKNCFYFRPLWPSLLHSYRNPQNIFPLLNQALWPSLSFVLICSLVSDISWQLSQRCHNMYWSTCCETHMSNHSPIWKWINCITAQFLTGQRLLPDLLCQIIFPEKNPCKQFFLIKQLLWEQQFSAFRLTGLHRLS